MQIIKTDFEGLYVIEPKVFGDERGYFFESYKKLTFENHNINIDFIQDNEAMSAKNVFRGFHYQVAPYQQSKLVRVIQGAVIDMVIDVRPESKTYGRSFQVLLSAQNKKQLLVPAGFAHGYLSLEDDSIFAYKVDQYYNRESEKGISFMDVKLALEWPIDFKDLICSEKDKHHPKFGEHFQYEE